MSTKASTLSLYRSILRTHSKSLPIEMRSLGDAYVKSEFRLHKDVTNDVQLKDFFSEWKKYLKHIQETAIAKAAKASGLDDSLKTDFGVSLDHNIEMNEEQKIQLQKLQLEAAKLKDM